MQSGSQVLITNNYGRVIDFNSSSVSSLYEYPDFNYTPNIRLSGSGEIIKCRDSNFHILNAQGQTNVNRNIWEESGSNRLEIKDMDTSSDRKKNCDSNQT